MPQQMNCGVSRHHWCKGGKRLFEERGRATKTSAFHEDEANSTNHDDDNDNDKTHTQRAQYPLIKEYPSNYKGLNNTMI